MLGPWAPTSASGRPPNHPCSRPAPSYSILSPNMIPDLMSSPAPSTITRPLNKTSIPTSRAQLLGQLQNHP
ncbi:hypothetical protein PGTUg99_000462 [Puccinia graminis f. sp. tritici]|uniref:Uncharacterized protein n=1 Tax=Puccinia graminis f. sp. tritici TaxID=56615 RepID=A0A5B0S342_PUCGR|nr:hypothetical protein PGTUg99_000462 [Puccinia graminis f. sp. tritici]